MDALGLAIQRCNLQLKMDNPTEGFGNCFPNAIVQQCRRPEVRIWLLENKPSAIFNGQQSLRNKVAHFAMKSSHIAVTDLKRTYEQEIGPIDNKSWSDYWYNMAQDGTWVDHIFLQMVAWYMELDLLILTTSSQPENPLIFISGNINNILAPDSIRARPRGGDATALVTRSATPWTMKCFLLLRLEVGGVRQQHKLDRREEIRLS